MRPGMLFFLLGEIDDARFIRCDGRLLDKKKYCNLFEEISDKYSLPDDPSDSFRVPNMIDKYIREYDDNNPPPVDIGTVVPSSIKDHTHNYKMVVAGEHTHRYSTIKPGSWFHVGSNTQNALRSVENQSSYITVPAGAHTHEIEMVPVGGKTTRPKSFTVKAYITA